METIQTEIDAINKMPLRIAYLVPLDSLGKVIEDEYMEFDQIHSYKILAITIIISGKYLSDGLTGVHCTVSHIMILMGD